MYVYIYIYIYGKFIYTIRLANVNANCCALEPGIMDNYAIMYF